jgi:hypothetical protein
MLDESSDEPEGFSGILCILLLKGSGSMIKLPVHIGFHDPCKSVSPDGPYLYKNLFFGGSS